jgi:hypothetical protein
MLRHNILIDWKRAHSTTFVLGDTRQPVERVTHTYTVAAARTPLPHWRGLQECYVTTFWLMIGTHTCAPRTVHMDTWYTCTYMCTMVLPYHRYLGSMYTCTYHG